jgi:hypothetical protein
MSWSIVSFFSHMFIILSLGGQFGSYPYVYLTIGELNRSIFIAHVDLKIEYVL